MAELSQNFIGLPSSHEGEPSEPDPLDPLIWPFAKNHETVSLFPDALTPPALNHPTPIDPWKEKKAEWVLFERWACALPSWELFPRFEASQTPIERGF